jgi:hypothetical protein
MTHPSLLDLDEVGNDEKEKTTGTDEITGPETGDYDTSDDLGLNVVGDDTPSEEKAIT